MAATATVQLEVLGGGSLCVVKLAADAAVPQWAMLAPPTPTPTLLASFISIVRTADELSIVTTEAMLPDDHSALLGVSGGWSALKVRGPLDFSLTGILSALAAPLAAERISIFAVSTYDTDYVLVKTDTLDRAKEALTQAGHTFV
eukprot:TRINITY_DN4076_c0_g1_i1.p1 TRINITY_DN4076_c0_g1~~TRINITY_DN4076_c0_g1_i1.p1  ORF type:complete len:145 (-),score=34.77 TRINITY_DN4076_c0_g1_i1:27-461(-)